MNVSQPTINALYDIIGECFQYNRMLDRWVSVLGVEFACNNVAKRVHEHMAHFFPMFSDKIGELCLERYNITVEYAATDAGKQKYNTVTEMIQLMEDKLIYFQNMFAAVLKTAYDNSDLNVYADLLQLMREYSPLVEQSILLNDKIQYYGESQIMKFDHDVEEFWVLGGDGDDN